MTSLAPPAPVPTYSDALILSGNVWVEQLTTDIPFLAVGILTLAVITCLLVTQRLSLPSAAILASGLLAFFGAIFDFSQLIQRTNDTEKAGSFAFVVLREVSLSLSLALSYFFYLTYLGRPPRGEVESFRPEEQTRARRNSPATWGYWGILGYALQILLGSSIVAITVLEVIWRITGNVRGLVYMADGVIQGVVVLAFLGKIVLNSYFSPLRPRWKTIRDYSPVIAALSDRLAVVITNEFSCTFSESPTGRLLQAIELYILILLVLISPYYRKTISNEEKGENRRASSFRGLRFSSASRWSVLNTADDRARRDVDFLDGGRSTTRRLSSWLAGRLAVKKNDPQQDRLWTKDGRDLEAYPSPEIREPMGDGESPMDAKFTAKPLNAAASTSNPAYLNAFNGNTSPEMTTPNTTTPFSMFDQGDSGTPSTMTMPPKPRIPLPAPAVNITSQRNSLALSALDTPVPGKYTAKFEVRRSYESESDSPVYGINGIVQRAARKQFQERARRSVGMGESAALEQLQREQAELEKSVASMAEFSPSRSTVRGSAAPLSRALARDNSASGNKKSDEGGRGTTPSNLSGAISGSYKSEISLPDFPSPPDSPYNGGRKLPQQDPISAPGTPALNLKGKQVEPGTRGKNGTEMVDDMQFAMIPPRMPAAYEGRRASFPSATRESVNSSVDGMARIISAYAESEDDIGGKRVRMDGNDNTRLDVTSFIGELTTPRAERPPSQLRDFMIRGRRSSMDSRLSPLVESAYSPSVEIVDMSAKSSYIPMAISTDTPTVAETNKTRMVSFAPVSYVPSSRPRLRANVIPSNTLPASPRPAGGSPTGLGVSSPLANSPGTYQPPQSILRRPNMPLGNSGVTVATGGPNKLTTRPTYPGLGNRPVISAPFSQTPEENEKDYEAIRPVPAIKTQRF